MIYPYLSNRVDTHSETEKEAKCVVCCVFGWCLLRTQNGQLKHACLLVQHLLICDKSNKLGQLLSFQYIAMWGKFDVMLHYKIFNMF
ncbi:hypothetical protein T06_6571 [Trichinella sp. T6]|nr:hypothetical protein T06_6571 [Trichinella sp. T6]